MRKKRVAGFSLLELQIAFVILGIGLIGLGPLVITQIKHLRKIEGRMSYQTSHYLVPSTDLWARKLGAAASIQSAAPDPSSATVESTAVYVVSVVSLDSPATGEQLTATVTLTAIPQ